VFLTVAFIGLMFAVVGPLANRYLGHGASDRREQVLRPYLFASLYVHYMTAASDVAASRTSCSPSSVVSWPRRLRIRPSTTTVSTLDG